MKMFKYKIGLYIETNHGVYMPIGFISKCGFPVIYGRMWRIMNFLKLL